MSVSVLKELADMVVFVVVKMLSLLMDVLTRSVLCAATSCTDGSTVTPDSVQEVREEIQISR